MDGDNDNERGLDINNLSLSKVLEVQRELSQQLQMSIREQHGDARTVDVYGHRKYLQAIRRAGDAQDEVTRCLSDALVWCKMQNKEGKKSASVSPLKEVPKPKPDGGKDED